MSSSTWLRTARTVLTPVLFFIAAPPAASAPIVPYTLAFESEGLDLDTGTIVPIEPSTVAANPADPQPDIVVSYHSDRPIHAVVFNNPGVGAQIAFLGGVAFHRVDTAALATLDFTGSRVDRSFESGDTLVVRTDRGANYLLGNPIEDDRGVTFDTLLLDETPARPVLSDAGEPGPGAPPLASRVPWSARLIADDARHGDRFGISVAIAGHTVVAGAPFDDDRGGSSGSAYVFVRRGDAWIQQAKLSASDGRGGDLFGSAVALSGDVAIVGAPCDDHAGGLDAGSAYVFVRRGGTWSEQTKLISKDSASRDGFGTAVAVVGDTAVVGAPLEDALGHAAAGSAYVFERDGARWVEQRKLITSSPAGNRLGAAAAFSGDTAVLGAPGSAAVFPFVRSAGVWSQQNPMRAGDGTGGDGFGDSVAISGDVAVVGAPRDSHGFILEAGSAYVFARSGSVWSRQTKLIPSDTALKDRFGVSVAVSGDLAVVGSYLDDHSGLPDAGSAYAFTRDGESWSEHAKLITSSAAGRDQFGASVGLSGGTVVAGVPLDNNVGGTNAGMAYVFELNQPPLARCMDVTVSAGGDCTAAVSIDAGSFDPDGDPIALEQSPPGPFDLGETSVTLTVSDDQGSSGSCVATVLVEDTTAPRLSVDLSPHTLWPPNRRMVEIEAIVTASDNCGAPRVALVSVTDNESDDAQTGGDGSTTDDVQPGADDFHFSLRAERAGNGDGRFYTAVYTATDGSGNSTSTVGVVEVPHDSGRKQD